ncbi:uncharacterized protein LOC144159695 isoform X3 [Haemaphysalis longicornis]
MTRAEPGGGGEQSGRRSPDEPVSLPIREDHERRLRLASERRREYNEFLSKKEAEAARRQHRRRATSQLEHLRRTPPPPDAAALPSAEQRRQSTPKDRNGGRQSRCCRDVTKADLDAVSTLKEETAKLSEERKEFAKLIGSLKEVLSEVEKPATRDALTGCLSRQRAQSRCYGETDTGENVDAQWERSQSLDRGLKGASQLGNSGVSLRKGGSHPTQLDVGATSRNADPERPACGSQQLASRAYLKDLEAQIREKRERTLREKEEEARLDRKCIEEYHDPWGRDLATTLAVAGASKRPRFLGDLVQPVQTSSDIMPSKARSETNLLGEPPRGSQTVLARRHQAALFKPSRKLASNVLPPSVYREELRKQMEEKRLRLEEQRRRDREEEEKLERRVGQQRLEMLREYQRERCRPPPREVGGAAGGHQADERRMLVETRRSVPHARPPKDMAPPLQETRKVKSDVLRGFRTARERSESRDRMASNLEILRRQLATEQQINRIQQMQRNYVVAEAHRGEE